MYEFFMTYQWEMWAVAALVFLVLELMAGDFFMLCLAAGAVCSAVAAACGGSFTLCLVLCSVITVASLFFLRPKALKRFRGGKTRKSNADALDGKTGIVKEEIKTGGYGRHRRRHVAQYFGKRRSHPGGNESGGYFTRKHHTDRKTRRGLKILR